MKLRLVKLFAVILLAILATYFAPKGLSSVFYVLAVISYFRSDDEALWLTFFFVVSDGFLGFFNNYEAVVSIIPGLPEVEVGHFYVAAAFVKALRIKEFQERPFYQDMIAVLMVYVLFLVVQGYAIGVSSELRVHFRILKFVLPLTLFYSIPRLFTDRAHYRDVFLMFAPFAFLALFAQAFTVSTGLAPSQFIGVRQDLWFIDNIERGTTYRGFYSTGMVLISFFGALYYTTVPGPKWTRTLFLAVILSDFLSAFLSATRGWVLSFSAVLFLHALFVVRLKPKLIAGLSAAAVVFMFGLTQIPAVEKQFSDAGERLLTVGLVAQGDVTAGGTLERLDRRAPRVMAKWAGSPLTGWGFSDEFHDYSDSHVGNHNVLLHAGVIGAILLALFLGYFCWSIVRRSLQLPWSAPERSALLLFPIFLLGWFIIHSSSGQQFQFYGEPGMTIPEALFFSFGAFCYRFTDPGTA